MTDAPSERFGKTAQLVAEQQDRRAADTRERLRRLLTLTGDERALDVGTGAGALAIALAPFVREAIGVDVVPELLAEGRVRAPRMSSSSRRTQTRCRSTRARSTSSARPGRCTTSRGRSSCSPRWIASCRPGGTMVVVDLVAPVDPLAAMELNTFERARDPSTSRILADVDLRGLFDSNNLVLRAAEIVTEERDLERYLDLAGCQGEDRDRVAALTPRDLRADYGWYVLHKPGFWQVG